MSKSIGVNCPYCNRRTWTSKRQNISRLTQTLDAACKNPDCMASFNVTIEITGQKHAGKQPDLELQKQLIK